jgi:hypothetical protein
MQTAQEFREHYRAVRARLWTPPPAPKPVQKTGLRLIYRFPIGPFLPPAYRETTYQKVKSIVFEHAFKHGLTVEEMMAENRSPERVAIRSELYWRLRKETTWSLPRLGKYLNRDHTTLLHGINRHAKRLEAGQ